MVLEFQLTSNVRLNNLNSLDKHPIKQYLKHGIKCVQGTDGAALYGTNSIDEQLSLATLLELSDQDLKLMKDTESNIIEESRKAYSEKKIAFSKMIGSRDMEDVLLEKMKTVKISRKISKTMKKYDANTELKDKIEEIVWDRFPVVLLGGSFNTENRATRVTQEGARHLDSLLEFLNPEDTCFIIGHKLSGYEKYLLEHNSKKFRIYAVIPALVTQKEIDKLRKYDVDIRVSTESEGMGIYKSFNYEIFERRPSLVVAFDGNSAAANLIQEARNGKGKAAICVWSHSKTLKQKAASLKGYVHFFDENNDLVEILKSYQKELPERMNSSNLK